MKGFKRVSILTNLKFKDNICSEMVVLKGFFII